MPLMRRWGQKLRSSGGARVAAGDRVSVPPSDGRPARRRTPRACGAGLPSPLPAGSGHWWHRRAARRAAVITPCALSPLKRFARCGVLAARRLCGVRGAGSPGNGGPLFRLAHRGVRVRRRRFARDARRAQGRSRESEGAPTKARACLRGLESGLEAAGGAALASDAPTAPGTALHTMRRICSPAHLASLATGKGGMSACRARGVVSRASPGPVPLELTAAGPCGTLALQPQGCAIGPPAGPAAPLEVKGWTS